MEADKTSEAPRSEPASQEKAPETAPASETAPVIAKEEAAPAPEPMAAVDSAVEAVLEPVPQTVREAIQEEEPLAAPIAGIRLEKKHPLAIRWMHWINFPVLATMIWSGLLIYWGDSAIDGRHQSQVYRIGIGSWTLFRFFPQWFWQWMNAPYRLTVGLGYHFFFMWFFMLNGLAYVLYTVISGEWRYLVPTKNSFKEAIQVTLHDLHIRKEPLPHRKFNGAQQIAYTSVILMG